MTPREELLQRAGDALCEDDPLEALANLFDEYAIGKWVPVSERLPAFDDGQFMGWIRFNDGTLENDLYSDCMIKEYASHWLDLDMPEVETD